jgi:hypothetical protein
MSYWIPTLILALVVIVLVAQLPWHSPKARPEEEVRLDLALPEWEQDSPTASEEEREAVHST